MALPQTPQDLARLGAGGLGNYARQYGAGMLPGQPEYMARQQLQDFNPYGTPRLRNLMRRRVINNARSQMRGGQTLGRLYGLDPQQQNYANVLGQQQAGEGVANSLNDFEAGLANRGQDYLERLMFNRLDAATQERIARQQAKAQQQGGFGHTLGSLAGAGIGFLAGGPYGAAAGYKAGSSI